MIYLFVLSSNMEEARRTFQLLETLHEALIRLDSEENKSLLRPISLRISSFFNHAAQIMRKESAVSSLSRERLIDTTPQEAQSMPGR